eukprot:g6285.t1
MFEEEKRRKASLAIQKAARRKAARKEALLRREKRKEDIEKRRIEEERKMKVMEEEEKKRNEEEKKRKEEEEKKRKEEMEKRRQEEVEKKRREEEEKKRKEEEEKKRREEEEKRRQEEVEKKRKEEVEKRRQEVVDKEGKIYFEKEEKEGQLRLQRKLQVAKEAALEEAEAMFNEAVKSIIGSKVPNISTNRAGVQLVVEQLLRTVGTKQDVDQYMDLYGGSAERFAIIKVGGEVIQYELDTFAAALSTLHKIGLCPIVVHGAGPQMNAIVEERGLQPSYVGGMRVTDGETLKLAREVFLDVNLELVRRLEEFGTPARPVAGGVFEAVEKDPRLGYVGEIQHVDTRKVKAAVEDGYLPVVLPLAETASGQILNVNADVAAREMALSIKPLKTIFINAKGGWVEPDGTKLEAISMSSDYEEMASRNYEGRQGTLLKLNELKLILDSLPPPSSISLTSASGLVRELFTHRGAGTLVHHGDNIEVYEGDGKGGFVKVSPSTSEEVDQTELQLDDLTELLGNAFGQQLFWDGKDDGSDTSLSSLISVSKGPVGEEGYLRPSYLEDLLSNNGGLLKVYVSEHRRAAAIIRQGPDSDFPPYMCKFAVTEQALGQGTADTLWHTIERDYPKIYWRSHTQSHEINSWFFDRADGMQRTPKFHNSRPGEERVPWTVYWRGLSIDERQVCIDDASARSRSYLSKDEYKEVAHGFDENLEACN